MQRRRYLLWVQTSDTLGCKFVFCHGKYDTVPIFMDKSASCEYKNGIEHETCISPLAQHIVRNLKLTKKHDKRRDPRWIIINEHERIGLFGLHLHWIWIFNNIISAFTYFTMPFLDATCFHSTLFDLMKINAMGLLTKLEVNTIVTNKQPPFSWNFG